MQNEQNDSDMEAMNPKEELQGPVCRPPAGRNQEEGRLKAGHRTEHNGLEFEEVEPWPEAVNGAVLLDELEKVMRRFVVLPKYAAETLALWCLHTYAFQLREVSTYLGIESPKKRCGKTTLLSLLSELTWRPVASANISSPALFRVIEEVQPTLLIDEADTFLHGNDEIRGILNSGYTKKTAYVVRVGKQVEGSWLRVEGTKQSKVQGSMSKGSRLVRFSCWCPKVIAAIGRLPETLADRCIVIRMQRKLPGEECERLRFLQALPLKRRCVRFVWEHETAIAQAQPSLPASLHDRAGDIWEPLLALADIAGGEWPSKARAAAEGLAACAQENNPAGSLLGDILMVFLEQNAEKVFSRVLVEQLNSLENRPWMEARRGKPITELWLAQQLRAYGIRSRTMRLGNVVGRGYAQEDFGETFARYIPRGEGERDWEDGRLSGRD